MRSIRPASAGILLLAVFTSFLIVRSPARIGASAQAPRSGAASAITAEQAAPFIGDWLVSVGMNTFEATFSVGVKTDGGKITASARTTISLPSARARFLRITQTDTVADAPPWSIRNLRIYEAPAAAVKK